MSTPSTVRLRILDSDYQVACAPDEQEGLLKAARYLDEKMRAIRSTGNVIGTERIAVLVGLNVTHELLQQSGQSLGESRDLQRLTDKIANALGNQSQLEL
ncbi:MAG TPA: cell division protein ZapA [Pseudomonadales bacterium]|jgi:cell division protein ZapA|nr:cell division protein ZapA [Pseudomonadales bacterium]HNI37800.1 cell division protein ZapA [Pseudomonadales bacterium]HNL91258.1 cell division protein ZapA [Pseudomonadales bacterium]HNN87138.1 cell division protein ZapA [Pseudomonadales bacterium]